MGNTHLVGRSTSECAFYLQRGSLMCFSYSPLSPLSPPTNSCILPLSSHTEFKHTLKHASALAGHFDAAGSGRDSCASECTKLICGEVMKASCSMLKHVCTSAPDPPKPAPTMPCPRNIHHHAVTQHTHCLIIS